MTIRPRLVVAVVILVVVGFAARGSARRNWAYVQLLHGRVEPWQAFADAVPATDRPGQLARLRAALQRGAWPDVSRMLSLLADDPDRLAPLLVIQEAERRAATGDLTAARAALRCVSEQPGYDASVRYRLGDSWERAQSAVDAVREYERGSDQDDAGGWTEGRYRVAMIYQRDGQWAKVKELLAPLLAGATDADLERQIRPRDVGGAVWQGTFLALGEAYEHLGKPQEAKATYDRLARIAVPRRDWTFNRALVLLAGARRRDGEWSAAVEPIVRALDVAAEFEPSYRTSYEQDTATEAVRIIAAARAAGQLEAVERASAALTERAMNSAGAWFVHGLVNDARCDRSRAQADYVRAKALLKGGAGIYLSTPPALPWASSCSQS